jgi:hypothetical protein
MPLRAGTSRTPQPKLASHAAFPGLAALPDRTLLHVWRDGSAHTGGGDGRILAQRLDPASLRPLDAPWLAADDALDLRDPSVAVSRDGSTVHLTFFSYARDAGGRLACRTWSAASTDGGRTFGRRVRIGEGLQHVAITAPVVPLPDGRLLAVAYGRRTAQDDHDSCLAFSRAPGGGWSAAGVIADGTAARRHYQEPYAIALRNGAVLAALRYGAKDRIGVSASRDGGRTWTVAAPKFEGWGRPTLLELGTGPTVCIYRGPGVAAPYPALYRVSPDRGSAWGAPGTLERPGAMMSYAAAVETGPGLASVVLGREDSGTVSTVRALHLADVDA